MCDRLKLIRILLAAALFAAATLLEESRVCTVISIICIVLCGADAVYYAVRKLITGDIFNEFLMITLSAATAVIIGEPHEGAAVMFFYCLGEYLASLAESKAEKVSTGIGIDRTVTDKKTEWMLSRFAHFYTPCVIVGAILVVAVPQLSGAAGELSEWVRRALSLVVVSCPCAVVISVPLAFVCGITSLTGYGVAAADSGRIRDLCTGGIKTEKNDNGQAFIRPDGKAVAFAEAEADPDKVIKKARSTVNTAWANVGIFLIVKCAVILLSIMGKTNIALAALSDTGLVVLCVLNSMHLLKKIK